LVRAEAEAHQSSVGNPAQVVSFRDMDKDSATKADAYWERAGEIGYAKAMYSSADVERHVRQRLWNITIGVADEIGIPREGRVLDYGCGDGAFAREALAPVYRTVDGYDKAEAAIERAKAEAPGPHLTFKAVDLTTFNYDGLSYDGAFLIGILHHIKAATPAVVRSLARATDKMVVLEPNGDNLVRKALEFTPTYKAAGEDSFRARELIDIFESTGWRTVVQRRLNIFPNFTPVAIYRLLAALEPRIEASRLWNGLCTVNMFGVMRR
jgi:2-polyprenyl-3-methyl-5-hydroxy-6-metoxy-1,4-benzoquinol methylase